MFPTKSGGVERFVYELSKELVKMGHTVKVITSSRGKPKGTYYELMDGMQVIRFPEYRSLLEAPIIPHVSLQVLKEDFDVLHVHGMVPMMSELAMFFGKIKRRPIVLTYHYDAETLSNGFLAMLCNLVYTNVAKAAVRFADYIVSTTKSYAATSSVLREINDKLVIIPCGVNLKKFNSPSKSDSRNPDDTQSNINILYVGKLIHYKGLRSLISAFSIIQEYLQNARLILIGDGVERRSLEGLCAQRNIKNVIFCGWVDDEELVGYYSKANVVVLPSIPSRREAFGMVLLEAMACGKPVVASDIPGVRDVVPHNSIGLLVKPKDPEALVCAVMQVLNWDRWKVDQLAVRYAHRFDWGNIAQSYESLYHQIKRV